MGYKVRSVFLKSNGSGSDQGHKTWLGQPSFWQMLNPPLCPYRIQQSIPDFLSIAVPKTRATELPPHTDTLRVTAVCFGVGGLLSTLVTSGSLTTNDNNKKWPQVSRGYTTCRCARADSQWSCCRPSPARCGRCSAVPPRWFPRRAAPHEGWPWCRCRTAGEAARDDKSCERFVKRFDSFQNTRGVAYRLVHFLVVATFADQAVLVFRLFLRRRGGGSVHQRAGACVGAGCALWISPKSSWSSWRRSRCTSGLNNVIKWRINKNPGASFRNERLKLKTHSGENCVFKML